MKEPFVSEALGTDDDLPRCLKDKVLRWTPSRELATKSSISYGNLD